MESKTAKKKFCSTQHRVYWSRQQKYSESGSIPRNTFEVTDLTKGTNEIKPSETPKTNYLISTERIAQIVDLLKLPPKYLPSEKRNKLEKELSNLKNQL